MLFIDTLKTSIELNRTSRTELNQIHVSDKKQNFHRPLDCVPLGSAAKLNKTHSNGLCSLIG